MDKPRICGDACHRAKRKHCDCFCRGIFHGWRGEQNRKRLVEELGISVAADIMTSEDDFFELAPPWVMDLWLKAEAV